MGRLDAMWMVFQWSVFKKKKKSLDIIKRKWRPVLVSSYLGIHTGWAITGWLARYKNWLAYWRQVQRRESNCGRHRWVPQLWGYQSAQLQSRIRVHRALKDREGKNKAPGLETQGMLWGQYCIAGEPVFKAKAHLDTTKCPLWSERGHALVPCLIY